MSVKPKRLLCVSAINIYTAGPLTVALEFLSALVSCPRVQAEWDIIVFCHSRRLFATIQAPFITYQELPLASRRWTLRIYYEYVWFWIWSKGRDIDLWLSLADVTPNVIAKRRVVYCHCAAPFATGKSHWLTAPRWEIFRRCYPWVYRINLQKNEAVVVQQQWFREAFSELTGFDKRKIIVARPALSSSSATRSRDENYTRSNIHLFYPAGPRRHKNFEVLFEAMALVAKLNVRLVVTIDGTENAYTKAIKKQYGKAENIVFAGFISLEEVHQQYARCDALVFPSKLETWGLPLSEFRCYGRPILAADLPYAWEVLAGYPQACYFRPDDAHALADLIRTMVERGALPFKNRSLSYEPPFAASWEELLPLLGL